MNYTALVLCLLSVLGSIACSQAGKEKLDNGESGAGCLLGLFGLLLFLLFCRFLVAIFEV